MQDIESEFYALLDRYNQLKESCFVDNDPLFEDDFAKEITSNQIVKDEYNPDYERYYRKLQIEYHKLNVLKALSNFYLAMAKSKNFPLPNYSEIASLAMKTIEMVDPENKSKAMPGKEFRYIENR